MSAAGFSRDSRAGCSWPGLSASVMRSLTGAGLEKREGLEMESWQTPGRKIRGVRVTLSSQFAQDFPGFSTGRFRVLGTALAALSQTHRGSWSPSAGRRMIKGKEYELWSQAPV